MLILCSNIGANKSTLPGIFSTIFVAIAIIISYIGNTNDYKAARCVKYVLLVESASYINLYFDHNCSGNGSSSVPGGGPIMSARPNAAIGLSAEKWLATCYLVVTSTVATTGLHMLVIISLTVALVFNASPPALRAAEVSVNRINRKSATLL